jgi:hypothetical protein
MKDSLLFAVKAASSLDKHSDACYDKFQIGLKWVEQWGNGVIYILLKKQHKKRLSS